MTQKNIPLKNTVKLGKVKKAYGIKGELLIVLLTQKAQWIYDLPQIALQHSGFMSLNTSQSSLTFFDIEKVHQHKTGYVIKLCHLNNRTDAEYWQGAFIYVPQHFFTSQPGEKIYLMELKNFIVVNRGQEIGPIVGFASNGPQDLLQVKKDGQTYPIPFVKAFLKQIDWQAQQVDMDLPEGLFDE